MSGVAALLVAMWWFERPARLIAAYESGSGALPRTITHAVAAGCFDWAGGMDGRKQRAEIALAEG
jgi:hypothetical protein